MRLFILLGLIGLSSLLTTTVCINHVDAACTNKKLLPALKKLSAETNLSNKIVKVKMPKVVSMIVSKCIPQESQDLAFLKAQKKEFIKAYDILSGPSGAMVNYCTTLSGNDIVSCFKQQEKAQKDLNLLVKKAQDLYWNRYDALQKEKKAAKKAAKNKASKSLLEEGNKQLKESQKVLKALKELNNLVPKH